MKTVTISKIERKDEISKRTGKGYQRVYIWTEAGGDTKLSGFGDIQTDGWNVGDTVTIEITQVGAFWNFKTIPMKEQRQHETELVKEPNEMDLFRAQLHELNFRLGAVEQLVRDFAKTGAEKVFAEMEDKSPYQEPKF